MYDNSRVPSYTNVSSHPCRVPFSHWSLDTLDPPTTGSTINSTLSKATGTLASTSYLSKPQQVKQVTTPNYVNYAPPTSLLPPLPPTQSSSSSHFHNSQRPKSTIFWNSVSTNQPVINANGVRQRSESKAIVGIVKPMVHQRSLNQLNNSNIENEAADIMITSYDQNLKRSFYPSPSPTLSCPPSEASSVIYRSRPISSYNSINNHPPTAPRRHSSINNSKPMSSCRLSRTVSTTSSIVGCNEPLTRSIYENEQQQQQQQQQQQYQSDERIIVDIKRLEMFYGSVGTIVKSTYSIARLYTTTTRQLINFENLSCQQYGVPVWIYNTGANLKRARQIRLLLAQHESCFAIWSTILSDKAELRVPKNNCITFWLPESNLLIGFVFEYQDACRLFIQYYFEILEHERRINLEDRQSSTSENMLQQQPPNKTTVSNKEIPRRYSRLRTISNKHDKEQQQQPQQESEPRRSRSLSRIRTVKKSSISGPINFEHVNHISIGCNRERPLSGTATLRSLHASMSHLPTNGTLTDRYSKQTKIRASTLFEPRATAV